MKWIPYYIIVVLLCITGAFLKASEDPLLDKRPVWRKCAQRFQWTYREGGERKLVTTTEQLLTRFVQGYENAYAVEHDVRKIVPAFSTENSSDMDDLLKAACALGRLQFRLREYCALEDQAKNVKKYYAAQMLKYSNISDDIATSIADYLVYSPPSQRWPLFFFTVPDVEVEDSTCTIFEYAQAHNYAYLSLFGVIERWGSRKAASSFYEYFWTNAECHNTSHAGWIKVLFNIKNRHELPGESNASLSIIKRRHEISHEASMPLVATNLYGWHQKLSKERAPWFKKAFF